MTNKPITFDPVRARTYCRNLPDRRETWKEVAQRCGEGFRKLVGEAVPYKDVAKAIENCEVFPAGRWLWIGGTDWVMKPKNHMAAFNCISFHLDNLQVIRDAFDLCCQGCGIGEILEDQNIKQLPPVRNEINVKVLQESLEEIGTNWLEEARLEHTAVMYQQTKGEEKIVIRVGDSREGWADAIFELLKLATNVLSMPNKNVEVDLSYVRPGGTPIKGFGGISNPVGLPKMFRRIGEILKGSLGRQLTDEELALIIDEGAEAVVAGNVRRSAGMKQFNDEAPNYKEKLYTQDEEGNFSVDHKRQPLRMSNHTKVFHYSPSHEQVLHSVRNQYQTGEGALQYAPAAIARANRDLLDDEQKRMRFIHLYENNPAYAAQYLYDLSGLMMYREELDHRMSRYGLNPCFTYENKVMTVHQGNVEIGKLAERGEPIDVYCVDPETNKPYVRTMQPAKTGVNQKILKVTLDSGTVVRCTENHIFYNLHRNEFRADELKPGQSLLDFRVHKHPHGHLRIIRSDKSQGHKARQKYVHRLVAENWGIDLSGVIHHRDHNPENNLPENLEPMSHYEHQSHHYPERAANGFDGKCTNHKVVSVEFDGYEDVYCGNVDEFHTFVIADDEPVGKSFNSGTVVHNCAEILGSNFACNLSEVQLVNADPEDTFSLKKRFRLAAQMACAMLDFKFPFEKLEISRQYDPIIGVGLTGWFDFCVKAFGEEWLEWCFAGRPKHTKKGWELFQGEIEYLNFFRKVVNETVTEYCQKRGIKRPNRTTTIKPSGTLSQLSGACPGGHPSKAAYFIRRVTFSANDPVALACLRAGYNVVPSQRCTDSNGNLLDDPFDPRVDEWLVEMPVKAEWTNYVESYFDTQEIPALAQFDIAMTLQKHYAEHNVSYTIEYDEDEIEDLANAIYEEIGNGNYISFAMMQRARAGQLKHAFPRLPYEPISKEEFYKLSEKIDRNIDFDQELKHAYQEAKEEDKHDVGTTGCDSTGCTL